MIHLRQSDEIFDSKPFKKKLQRQKQQQMIQKKLVEALSQCISSYMQSQFQNNDLSKELLHRKKNQQKEITSKSSFSNSNILKQIYGTKKSQIHKKIIQMTHKVQEDMFGFVCSMLKEIKYNESKEQQSTRAQQNPQNVFLLTESNRNFILQLMYRLELLESYKGVDRSFSRLINQAQKVYYLSYQGYVISQNTQNNNRKKIGIQNYQKNAKNIGNNEQLNRFYLNQSHQSSSKFIDSNILSMRRRLKQIREKHSQMSTMLQQGKICGYSYSQQKLFEPNLQFSKNSFDQKNNNISSQLYFTDFSVQKNHKQIFQPQKSGSMDFKNSDKQHIKIIQEWKSSLKKGVKD